MLIITIEVDRPPGQAIGIKEDIAMFLERYGDARVVSIIEKQAEQISMFGGRRNEDNYVQGVRRKNRIY